MAVVVSDLVGIAYGIFRKIGEPRGECGGRIGRSFSSVCRLLIWSAALGGDGDFLISTHRLNCGPQMPPSRLRNWLMFQKPVMAALLSCCRISVDIQLSPVSNNICFLERERKSLRYSGPPGIFLQFILEACEVVSGGCAD